MPSVLPETHVIGAQTHERIATRVKCSELNDYGIDYVGLSDATSPYAMVRPAPNFTHLLICTGGLGQVFVGDRWEYCRPGDTYLSRAGTYHAFRAVPKQRWQFAWIMYDQARPWHQVLPPTSTRASGDGHALSAAIEGLYRELAAHSPIETTRLRWIGLIDLYWQQIAEFRSKYGRLTALWERVDQSPAHPWTIVELGRQAGLSHEHLRRIALVETGRSPMMQVTWLRMNRAITLLQSTSLKIEAVATAVGYTNPFAFSSAFRRWIGCPPSKYAR